MIHYCFCKRKPLIIMKKTLNHLINSRELTTFHPLDAELTLQPGKNYLFDLAYLGVIDITGDKAREFLQGQLTCDMNALSDIQMVQGAQCNLKGRILALMDVVDWMGVKLILPQDLVEATINSLNKTAMLSRIGLKKNVQLRILGFYLQDPQDLTPDTSFFPNPLYASTYGTQYCCFHLGKGFYIFVTEHHFAQQLVLKFAEKNQLLGSLTWHTLRLMAQQIEIYPESRGVFLPHRLDLHQTPYLSFNKGCYKGQEIIARMHYKATIKHQLTIYTVKTEEQLYSGQKLLQKIDGLELGELVDFSILGKGYYLVAVSLLKSIEPLVVFEGHTEQVCLKEISFTLPAQYINH